MGHQGRRRLSAFVLAVLLLYSALAMSALAEGASTEKKTVRVSCGVNQALYLDDKGKPAGYLAYYIQQIAYVNGWSLEYVNASWSDSVQNLYDGKIDILFPTQKTEDRLDTMRFSDYIGGYQPIALFARADAEIYYDDYSAYDGKRIAISIGSSNEMLLEEYAAAHHFTYTGVDINTTEDKLAALQDGTVDMIVFSTLNDVPNAKVVSTLDYLPFYYCTRMDDAALMDGINKGMRSILSENRNVATTVFDAVLKGSTPPSFTREENELIQHSSAIRVGMYDDSLPLAGRNSSGEIVGIYVDLLGAIEDKVGIPIEPVLIPRDKLLYSSMTDGTVDFVLGSKSLAYNEEDVSLYMCSESVMDYITVAITRSDYAFDEGKAPVFVLTNTRRYWVDEVYKRFPNATVTYCSDVKECLAMVACGKADVTLMNTWEYNYQSKNARFASMMEWESLRKQTDLVLGVRKGTDATLMSIVEKAIDQVAGQDKESIVAANLNMPYADYELADTWFTIRYPVLIALVVLVLLAVGLSITRRLRRRYTRALEQKNAQLEKSNEAKDLFLSRMSHELRTPLNAINGYATVLRQNAMERKVDPEQTLACSDAILRAGKYQLAIISDLLDIQKIEAGKMELAPVEVDSAEYMQNIVAMIGPEAEEKGIDFTYQRLSSVSPTYLMDGVHFEQVLLNLLHNAVKFTPSGGKVRLTAEVIDHSEAADVLKFVVSDTGVGMSEDFRQNYLFHRFAQEYKGNTSPYEGCGIGLAISREIIHQMGGEITCESHQGAGSTFTVVLTAKHGSAKRSRRNRPAYDLKDLSGVTVLLCEDNLMNQRMERGMLEKLHCQVEVAENGRVGVDKFRQSAEGAYNIVLMDIRMPVMDGLEATRTIRAMNRDDAKTVPILAVSANSFEEDVRKSLEAGMNEHLSKPVDIRIFSEKIYGYCKAHCTPRKPE